MSNLSELLPAGGGGKNVEFVASGTLPNGKPVILNSNGTVTAISSTSATTSESIPAGSEVVFNSAESRYVASSFDPNTANKFVAVYQDRGNSRHGTAVVGTVSGTSITFGSEYVFKSSGTYDISIAFDPNTANKFIVAHATGAIVGTVSGTTLSFGSEYSFNSGNSVYASVAFDPNTTNSFVITYLDENNSERGTGIAGTVSGTALSFGSEVVFNSGSTSDGAANFDPSTAGSFVVTYRDAASSNNGTAVVGTVSGTSITFGSEYVFKSVNCYYPSSSFDPNTAGKFVAVYRDGSDSYYGKAVIGNISGTSITYGSTYTYHSDGTEYTSVAFESNAANKFVIIYNDMTGSDSAAAVIGTASGTALSFGSEYTIDTGAVSATSVSFDPSAAGKFVAVYRHDGNGSYGTAIVGQMEVTVTTTNLTATNFLGITDAAVASGASGSVTIKGGLKTGLAGGTFAVTVANSGAGNRYYINGVLQQTLNLREGFTYKFDQSASSNSGHPFRFSTTSNGTHAGGSEYTTGVTTSGTPGNAGAYTQIVVAASAPTLYYYCSAHSLMGGQANTIAAIVANSIYYVQGDGSISTASTAPAVRIGKALSSTTLNLEFSS